MVSITYIYNVTTWLLIYKRYGKNGIRYRNHTIAVRAVCTVYTENKVQCLYHEVCAHCPQNPVSLQQHYVQYVLCTVFTVCKMQM